MASRLAVRQPLTQRTINTTAPYSPQPQPTTSTPSTTTSSANASLNVSPAILKPLALAAGHKRTHSQITSGQENTPVQQQILHNAVTFKEPALPPPQRQILVTVTPASAKRPQPQARPGGKVPVAGQFKQPVKTAGVVAPRQRQETHDPGVRHAQQTDKEAEELEQWRRSMKRIISTSTFYFDGIEESLKEQASRWLFRHGGKVEQFFSHSVTVIVTSREVPQSRPLTPQDQDPKTVKPMPRTEAFSKNLHMAGSNSSVQPTNDIFTRAKDLGIRIWALEKFKRVLRCLTAPIAQPSPHQALGAALQAEKRHGRTSEQDPSVPREEYVYFQGPYILITDLANVHKPIMVREFPAGSAREDNLWPMFWESRPGCCPFIRPRGVPKPVEAKPVEAKPVDQPLVENKQVLNREVLASGIVNSSTAFSAIRSTTTCGSKSNTVTSALSGMGGAINAAGSLPRPLRDMKTRLSVVKTPVQPPTQTARTMEPVAKKRKVETPLREQIQAKARKKDKKEGYCENCKERFDDYDEHTLSRRHVKYARNDRNFAELDRLLKLLERPLLKEHSEGLHY